MQGNVVRKIKTGASKGVNRIVWNFRYSAVTPISLTPFDDSVPWMSEDVGYMVVPGKYQVSLSKFDEGKFTELVPAQEFVCKPLNNTTLPAEDKAALNAFNKKVADITIAINSANSYRIELVKQLDYFKKAVIEGEEVSNAVYNEIIDVELQLKRLNKKLNGDNLISRYEGARPTSIKERVDLITGALWTTTAGQTTTFVKSYEDAASRFDAIVVELKEIDEKVKSIKSQLEKASAPYTPGRFPDWRNN